MSHDDPLIRRATTVPAPPAEPSGRQLDLDPVADGGEPPRKPKRRRRRLAIVLMLVGVILVGYGAATVLWRDPLTDLYTRWEQHRLAGELEESFAEFEQSEAAIATEVPDPPEVDDETVLKEQLVARAKRFDRRLKIGQPLGRIIVPRLSLNKVFLHGTRWRKDLSRGPGHYPETGIPAIGQTVAIAGHRTTFGAPFRYIDKLRRGDRITLRLAYGTFHYQVVKHKIVDNSDWSIVKSRGYDAVVLTACHPLYSAAKRWVVFARLSWVEMMDGERLRLWKPRKGASA
jgi:sortase A